MGKRGKGRVVASLVLGFIECVCFGPIFMGWPNLEFVFKQVGVFSHLCDNSTGVQVYNGTGPGTVPGCAEADRMFSLCFSVASALFLASSFPIGLLFDRYGFWITRLSATIFFVPGVIMLAFSQEGSDSNLIFPGLIMLAIAGMHIIVTSTHLTLQAKGRKSVVAAFYSAGMNIGAAIFLAVKLVYDNHGIGHRTSLSFLAGLWVIVLVNTFVCCPRYKLSLRDIVGEKVASLDTISVQLEEKPKHIQGNVPNESAEIKAVENNEKETKAGKEITFVSCIQTPYFWLMAGWFSLLLLRFLFFVGSLNTWLTLNTGNDIDRVSLYTNAFSYIGFVNLLVAPIAGLLPDLFVQRGIASDCNVPYLRMAKALSPSLWIGSILATAQSVVGIFFSDALVYVNFVLVNLFRAFLFGNLFVYVNLVFPTAIFGKCLGLIYLTGAAMSCLQHAFFAWAEASPNFQMVNGTLLVLVVLTFTLPIFIEIRYKFYMKTAH